MDEINNLNELWVLPINMVKLDFDFNGYELFSSDKLKLKFFDAVIATGWGKRHSRNLLRLIKVNKIVPVLMSQKIRSFLSKKLFSDDWSKDVLGVYDPYKKHVLIFIDNGSSFLGLSSNKELAKTTLHELMHLSATSNKAGFFKIMKPTLQQFYSNYYCDIFSCKQNLNLEKTLRALYGFEGYFSLASHKKLMTGLREETKPFSTLDDKEYDSLFSDIFMVTRNFPLSPNLLIKYYPRFYHIFGPLNDAYLKTFGERNKYTSPAQELWAMSEVASVMVELLPSDMRVSKVLDNIK